jgi:hypothetical protein
MEGLDVTADMFNERLGSLVNEINGSEDQRSGLPLQNEPFCVIAQCRKPPSAARRSLIDFARPLWRNFPYGQRGRGNHCRAEARARCFSR